MTLEELWNELEARAPERAGRLRQRIHPDASIDLFVSFSGQDRQRILELGVARTALEDIDVPDGTRGIRSTSVTHGDSATLSLELIDRGSQDIFVWLAEDIARRTAAAENDEAAVSIWLGRLERWSRLLQRAPNGLSERRQRALYAELWFLEWLIDQLGCEAAVAAWTGPSGNPRDFETAAHGVEVKASAANEPQVVTINGERQLDDAELHSLHLVHLSLEPIQGADETLAAMVGRLRARLDGAVAAGDFEDRLMDAGYSDAHARRYAGIGYAHRRQSCFAVAGDFPRLIESVLPDGVGAVSYGLAIDACWAHEVQMEELERSLATGPVRDA